ncbi:hypothetical protein [Bacillus cereus group sp. BfR-BA-01318]|uniref:hypothetical protein n=1 Tax=unclassified Bacillus cereus group TaxID=2750818 RepID=UPI001298E78F|nr:hypothetical protein [Bacillus cereus group sp. BfR-BA-01318]MEB9419911.1 hypothetical protein [Bacillus cereus]MRD20713.1 hypothetical protein [Bacillus thuringiensis]
MRNVLVFPDGTEQDFMYPHNRDVLVGEKLQVQMKDNALHILEVWNIQHTDKVIYYHLKY